MVRKRAEHNELEISTLEEVTLHQQDIEKFVYIFTFLISSSDAFC